MYAALLKHQLVLAQTEALAVLSGQKQLNADEYRCPRCQQRMILVLSEEKSSFFKHFTLINKQAGEKWEHQQSKLLLKTALAAAGFKAHCEVPLAAGQLRADVLASPNLAFEVQCAPLSLAEFKHRHQLYQQIKVLDIWVVGRRHFLKTKLKQTQLQYLRCNQRWGCYLLEILPQQQRLRLRYNIWQASISRRLVWQTQSWSLDDHGLQQLWHFQPRLVKFPAKADAEKKYLQQQVQTKSNLGLKISEQLYQKRITLDQIPVTVFEEWRHPGAISPLVKFLEQM